jgi:cobalt-zinc-cadmium efflux system membrane fusion protein
MTLGANWSPRRLALALVAIVLVAGAVTAASRIFVQRAKSSETSRVTKGDSTRFTPTDAEWASLAFEPAAEQVFRAEHVTEGKIAVNEDSSTPIFSPYAGRVVKLMVKPSDVVQRGQQLFVIEATDAVQALNDTITALSALNSARSKLNLAQINEKRQNDLYAGKAVPLKDWQTTACAFWDARKSRSPPLSRPGRSAPTPPSIRRSAARSCSARSGPASSSPPAPAIPCSSSATSRRYG